ncbi:MAG: HypC/HybG/HupF family hydrogenase formation chaperone [Bacillota bacterium]|nr:HypC/HybG/HupF family hydrogenase formation chaperone [Bacillota bacterium]
MCIAIPAEVISIDNENHTAEVKASGNSIKVNISLVSPKIGDYVLVHAGYAVEIVKKESAQEIAELLRELEEFSAE